MVEVFTQTIPGPGGCAAGDGAATGRLGVLTVVGVLATGPTGVGTVVGLGLGLAMGAGLFALGGAAAAGTGAVIAPVLTMGDKAAMAFADSPAFDNSATEA